MTPVNHLRRSTSVFIAFFVAVAATVAIAPSARASEYSVERIDDGAGSMYDVARRIRIDSGQTANLTGAGIQVALIDTGVVDIPGLRTSNVTIGPDFSFEAFSPDLVGRDTNGHGTHLAGIIVGSDAEWIAGDRSRTDGRFLGIAPDAELVSVKVGSANGVVDVTQVIAAINWVVDSNEAGDTDIRVITLAYGTDGTQDYRIDPLAYAVERAWHAGIVVVAASGNDGSASSFLRNPALDPYVIAVGAAENGNGRRNLTLADYTNGTGSERGVDIVAPGTSIVSLRAVGAWSDSHNETGRVGERFVRGSGTSQAAAVVGGAVALLLQDCPSLTPDEVKDVLVDSARYPNATAAGFLDMAAAVNTTPTDAAQTWPVSDGTGSIEASRGTIHVFLEGEPLVGEFDIFGNDVATSSWTSSTWSGLSWNGLSWNGLSWNGLSWNGLSWNGLSWNGLSWNGLSWNGLSWNGLSWNGLSWNGLSWNGLSWNGLSWNGLSWQSLGDRPALAGHITDLRAAVEELEGNGVLPGAAAAMMLRRLERAASGLATGRHQVVAKQLDAIERALEHLVSRGRIDALAAELIPVGDVSLSDQISLASATIERLVTNGDIAAPIGAKLTKRLDAATALLDVGKDARAARALARYAALLERLVDRGAVDALVADALTL